MAAPFEISRIAPIKPIKTPIICLFVEIILNTKNPNKIVFIGTIEFNIDAINNS